MEKAIKRAIKLYEFEEARTKWNGRKKSKIGRKKGCLAWNKGLKKGVDYGL